MRMTTSMCLGIRHVGKADEPDEVHEGTVHHLMRILMERVVKTSVAKRLEFSFGRTESEVRLGWGEGKRGPGGLDSMADEFERMMAEMDAALDKES